MIRYPLPDVHQNYSNFHFRGARLMPGLKLPGTVNIWPMAVCTVTSKIVSGYQPTPSERLLEGCIRLLLKDFGVGSLKHYRPRLNGMQ